VLLDIRMLHLELAAGISGTAHVNDLWAEDDELEETAGCQLLKPGLITAAL